MASSEPPSIIHWPEVFESMCCISFVPRIEPIGPNLLEFGFAFCIWALNLRKACWVIGSLPSTIFLRSMDSLDRKNHCKVGIQRLTSELAQLWDCGKTDGGISMPAGLSSSCLTTPSASCNYCFNRECDWCNLLKQVFSVLCHLGYCVIVSYLLLCTVY